MSFAFIPGFVDGGPAETLIRLECLRRLIWIGKCAKGFGVPVQRLHRRIQKNEADPGGVYSFHADNVIVKYRNVVIDVADLTSRARPKLAKATNSVPKRTNLTILIRTLALWNTSWVIVAKVLQVANGTFVPLPSHRGLFIPAVVRLLRFPTMELFRLTRKLHAPPSGQTCH